MTGSDLVEWRRRLNLTQAAAAAALGCGRRSLQQWEDPARPQGVPKYIGLACAALALGIREYPSMTET